MTQKQGHGQGNGGSINRFHGLMLAGLLALGGASLGCEQDTGDHLEDAADETGEAVEQAPEDVEDQWEE